MTLSLLDTGGGDERIPWPTLITNNGIYAEIFPGGRTRRPTYFDDQGNEVGVFRFDAPGTKTYRVRFRPD